MENVLIDRALWALLTASAPTHLDSRSSSSSEAALSELSAEHGDNLSLLGFYILPCSSIRIYQPP